MIQINPEQLLFVTEAARVFQSDFRRETHINEAGTMIALRLGVDRDCVAVYELGDAVANFAQQVGYSSPAPREVVASFAIRMEKQLAANDHKMGWEHAESGFLLAELEKNLTKLTRCNSHEEFRRRCANIANFAMMLAHNDTSEEIERRRDAL